MDLPAVIPESVTWGGVLLTVAILIAGWIISRLAKRGVTALLSKMRGVPPTAVTVTARVISYTIILVAIGIALALMGANVQPVLAVVVIVAVVLALVLRGVADNFAAGVLIQSRRTVDIGDDIQVEGIDGPISGRVIELNARAVVILSRDGRTVHVPNAKLIAEAVVNNSRHGARRSEIQVRTARDGHAVDEIIGFVLDAAAGVDGVHTREHPRALVIASSSQRLTLRVQFWHHPLHENSTTSAVVHAVADALESRNIDVVATSDPGPAPLIPPDTL